MKKYLTIFLCMVVSYAFALKNAQITTTFNDNSTSTQTIALKEVEKDVYRLEIPIRKIALNTKFIDVKLADATAKKGEDGYWVLGDGRLGFFAHDKGNITERRNPLPLYGVKKGDSAFVGIVKGLKYEFASVVDVK